MMRKFKQNVGKMLTKIISFRKRFSGEGPVSFEVHLDDLRVPLPVVSVIAR
jgi:hypothetical protein